MSSFKLWLKYASRRTGGSASTRAPSGAARARHEPAAGGRGGGGGRVRGGRRGGGALRRRGRGQGIVNYSAGELRRIKGLKTEAVREVLPRATEEAVHRDYFVLD